MTFNKKIIFLSGKKGGFTAILPLLKILKNKNKIIIKTVLTDQHTQKKFGNTYKVCQKEIGKKFTKIIKFSENISSPIKRLIEMSKLLKNFSIYLNNQKPNMVLLYGDRLESLIAAIAASNLNIPICHFQGGDVSGNIDEKIRHSITKLSDLHLASNFLSLKRIVKMGENKKNCFNIGDSHIDALKKIDLSKTTFKKIKKKYNVESKNFIVFMFHPEGSSDKENFKNTQKLFSVLKKKEFKIICIYPCTDPGYEGIIKAINKYKKRNKKLLVYRNLPYEDFICLLKNSLFFIGNSSSGIIESTYLEIPSINIGLRQNNRLKSHNVISSSFNKKDLISAIKNALSPKYQKKSIYKKKYYGNGKSYKKAFKIIISKLNKISTVKKFYD